MAVSDSLVIFRWCTSQILKELVIVYLSNIRILFFLPFYSFYRFYSYFSMKHLQMPTNAQRQFPFFFRDSHSKILVLISYESLITYKIHGPFILLLNF